MIHVRFHCCYHSVSRCRPSGSTLRVMTAVMMVIVMMVVVMMMMIVTTVIAYGMRNRNVVA